MLMIAIYDCQLFPESHFTTVATTINFYWKQSIALDKNPEGQDAILCRVNKRVKQINNVN